MWRGVMWRGKARCDVVWYGVLRQAVVQCGMVLDVVCYRVARQGVMWCIMVWRSILFHSILLSCQKHNGCFTSFLITLSLSIKYFVESGCKIKSIPV